MINKDRQEPDIMEKTGLNNKIFLAPDRPFWNCDCLFVEYMDVLKSPWFIFLVLFKDNEILNSLFDLSEIRDLDNEQLYEWYTRRKYYFPFDNFKPLTEEKTKEELRDFMNQLMEKEFEEMPAIVNSDTTLNFFDTLQIIQNMEGVVKNIYIWTDIYTDSLFEDIDRFFNDKVSYVTGPLPEVLKEFDILNNSTFIFSDIDKIHILEKEGKLDYASILLAERYGYNYSDFEKDIYKVDIVKLLNDHVFKFNPFENLLKLN